MTSPSGLPGEEAMVEKEGVEEREVVGVAEAGVSSSSSSSVIVPNHSWVLLLTLALRSRQW